MLYIKKIYKKNAIDNYQIIQFILVLILIKIEKEERIYWRINDELNKKVIWNSQKETLWQKKGLQ